jgi:hypothetical protein
MTENLPAVTSSGGAVALSGSNPFLDAADDMGASSGSLFLRFDGNTGLFSFGKDQEELPKGTRVAVNPGEFKNGWICWKDGEVMDETMTRVVDGKPKAKGDLADYGPYDDSKDGWREQSSIQIRDIETGDEYLFKTSSKGGRIAVGNLVRDYGKSFTMHPGELAIVELQNTSFDAKDPKTGKKLGKKFAPVFKIVAWQSEADLIAKFEAAAAASEDAEGEPEEDVQVNRSGGRRNRNF